MLEVGTGCLAELIFGGIWNWLITPNCQMSERERTLYVGSESLAVASLIAFLDFSLWQVHPTERGNTLGIVLMMVGVAFAFWMMHLLVRHDRPWLAWACSAFVALGVLIPEWQLALRTGAYAPSPAQGWLVIFASILFGLTLLKAWLMPILSYHWDDWKS